MYVCECRGEVVNRMWFLLLGGAAVGKTAVFTYTTVWSLNHRLISAIGWTRFLVLYKRRHFMFLNSYCASCSSAMNLFVFLKNVNISAAVLSCWNVSDHKLLDLDLKIRETDRCTHWYAEPGPLLLVHDSLAGIQRDRVRDGGERDDVSESCKKGASGCYLKNEGTEYRELWTLISRLVL